LVYVIYLTKNEKPLYIQKPPVRAAFLFLLIDGFEKFDIDFFVTGFGILIKLSLRRTLVQKNTIQK